MKFLKHEKMRDVVAQVIEEHNSENSDSFSFKVLWVNILGTYWDPNPFFMGTSKQLAIETISIPKVEFHQNWRILSEPRV